MTGRNPKRSAWIRGPFVPHTLDLITGAAWRAAPPQLRRLLERLEIEHMLHAGQENGNLSVSYAQFVTAGISRRQIRPLLDLGQALGLLEVREGGGLFTGKFRDANVYRLTYVPEKGHRAPSDEWRSMTDDRANKLLASFRKSESTSRKQSEAVATSAAA